MNTQTRTYVTERQGRVTIGFPDPRTDRRFIFGAEAEVSVTENLDGTSLRVQVSQGSVGTAPISFHRLRLRALEAALELAEYLESLDDPIAALEELMTSEEDS